MKSIWLEKVIDSVADRGRELLGIRGDRSPSDLENLCAALLTQKGEASGTALAREILRNYQQLSTAQKLDFFTLLERRFGPDKDAIFKAASEFRQSGSAQAWLALSETIEPQRQRLFRRLNAAPDGTRSLVGMRADLLKLLSQNPTLAAVDTDLKRLLAFWFNRGFLELRRIDWRTSAAVLEKLITYESVHEIQSWSDLRRRLEADRRCFAFFHPALADEPLIFVEAALVRGMATAIDPLIDESAPVLIAQDADSVIFYSINNCLAGLRGVSFGNFLIKQVAMELQREFPAVKLFSTLSPMPGFRRALADRKVFTDWRLRAIVGSAAQELCNVAGTSDLASALERLLEEPQAHEGLLTVPLARLGLAYLVCARRKGKPLDPVAHFHLSNGAQLERINPFANCSPTGLRQSAGLMVNYRYISQDFESNHEAFAQHKKIQLGRPLQKEAKAVREAWISRKGTSKPA
jgi:malonyl-CoA decarboxylase